ncbi:MAG: hypothetical protein M3Y87_12735 [Myxococcota bacterium]|nr:hypothetical protein [Myxococcota bacterium]
MRGRGLVLVLLAAPVCAAIVVVVALLAVDMSATGEPISGRDVAGGLVFGGLALAVLAISFRAAWRARQHPGWRVYRALLMAGMIVGLGGGGIFGLQIITTKNARTMARVESLCARFEVRPERCEQHARACLFEVRADPPRAERGVTSEPELDPRAPSDPRSQAEWACLLRAVE